MEGSYHDLDRTTQISAQEYAMRQKQGSRAGATIDSRQTVRSAPTLETIRDRQSRIANRLQMLWERADSMGNRAFGHTPEKPLQGLGTSDPMAVPSAHVQAIWAEVERVEMWLERLDVALSRVEELA